MPSTTMDAMEYQRPKEQRKLRNVLTEVPEYLDVIGVTKVFEERSPPTRRLFWGFCVLFGLAFALYQIISQVIYFYTWPVNVYVNISLVNDAPFPRVVFCNYNQIRNSTIPGGVSEMNDIYAAGERRGFYKTWNGFYMYHAHQIEETLYECTWKGLPCDARNFTVQATDLGVCYAFNAGEEQITTSHTNEDYGLRLLLHVQDDEYLYNNYSYSEKTGFKVLLNEPYEPALVKGHGLSILVGVHNNIGLDRKTVQSLPEPWEGCENMPLKYFPKYSRHGCHEEHIMEMIYKQCGCRLLTMNISDVPVCSPDLDINCAQGIKKLLRTNLTQSEGRRCPTPCTEVLYSTYISHAYLSKGYLTEISKKHGQTVDYWRKNVAVVNVYYRSLVEEVVSHQPVYTTLSLLCDVGGALGLILGTSVLAFFEVIDFFIMQYIYR